MAQVPHNDEYTVTITKEALEAVKAASILIRNANDWVHGAPFNLDTDEAAKELARRWSRYEEMKRSWMQGWFRLTTEFNPHDGNIRITKDGEYNLFFRYDSGYHGALIFHVIEQDEYFGAIGHWQIHT